MSTAPGLHRTLVQRTVAGDRTVDQEHLTGFVGGDIEVLVAYPTGRDNRIERAVFLTRAAGGAAPVTG